ncbi:hypothetical protein HDU81_001344 [Chytriomyces hyalinus]|nr:hypothetical protein HDU81_001344 [Chytriomyces hyalinus]
MQGWSIQGSITGRNCEQFFSTNSTPTNLSSGPVLGASSSISTTAKAVQTAIPASAAATSVAAPTANSDGAAVHAGYALMFGVAALFL